MNKFKPFLIFIAMWIILNLAGSMVASTYGIKISELNGHVITGINLVYMVIAICFTGASYHKPQ